MTIKRTDATHPQVYKKPADAAINNQYFATSTLRTYEIYTSIHEVVKIQNHNMFEYVSHRELS